jgi:hypothetical protein
MATNLIVPSHAQIQKANIPMMAVNDGEPIVELTAEGFGVALHDSRFGPLIALDDLAIYPIEGLIDEAVRFTTTAATWARLKALVESGVVDQLLQ